MSKEVNLNALIPKELHKKFKIKLLQDEITYKDWLNNQIKDYLDE